MGVDLVALVTVCSGEILTAATMIVGSATDQGGNDQHGQDKNGPGIGIGKHFTYCEPKSL
jgi:hypothetical protein